MWIPIFNIQEWAKVIYDDSHENRFGVKETDCQGTKLLSGEVEILGVLFCGGVDNHQKSLN